MKKSKHADWAYNFIPKYKSITRITLMKFFNEIGKTFVKVLEDAGVYKCTDGMKGFCKFIQQL